MTDPLPPDHRIPAAAVVTFYLILGGGGVLLALLLFDINPLVPLPDRSGDPPRDLFLGAALGLLVVVLSKVLDRFFEWSRAMTRSFRQILGRLNRADVLILALASSIGEELLFRGFLLPWLGLVASSIAFGLIHGVSPGPPAHMWQTLRRFLPLVLAATVMGFAFGGLVEYTGNILAPVVAHFTINFLNLSDMYRGDWARGGASDGDG